MGTSAEKSIEKLQEETAATAFQLVWGTLGRIGRFIAEQESVQKGMQRYASGFLARYGQIKVLGMSEPVPLREIYAAARVVSPKFLHKFRTVEDLQESFVRRGQRGLFSGDVEEVSRSALELANGTQFLNVLGAPGAGKSTFLCRLGLEALLPRRTWDDSLRKQLGLKAGLSSSEDSQYQHDCLPVLVELRRFRTENIDILRLIGDELTTCGLPRSDELVKALLEDGRLLLLFDGLDEIPDDRLDKSIIHLRDFVDRYAGNRFVTSCRTAFYKDYFARFKDVVLADFDDEQIANFAYNWFRSDRDREQKIADAFLKLLKKTPAALELARTPLLLTFLCLTYDDGQQLPANRSTLYREALDILLKKWAASKRVHNESVYQELHAELEVQMLAGIAAPAFRNNRYFFTRQELVDNTASFLRDELNAPKRLDSASVLDAIEIQQGLIVQRSRDVYSFSHLTLQEYLTAEWYVSNQQLGELISEHLEDDRWREVILLAAGRVGRVDDLLVRMLDRAEQSLSSAPDAAQLLRWAGNEVVPSGDEQLDAALRALAVSLFLITIFDRDSDRPTTRSVVAIVTLTSSLYLVSGMGDRRNFVLDEALLSSIDAAVGFLFNLDAYSNSKDNLAVAKSVKNANDKFLPLIEMLASRKYFKGLGPETIRQMSTLLRSSTEEGSDEIVQTISQRSRSILAQALGLTQREILISPEDLSKLRKYLRACGLLVDCRGTATSVSRYAWEGICRRMINPPG